MKFIESSTRRRFLKTSGTSLMGTALTGYALTACGSASGTASTTNVTATPTSVTSDPLQRLLQGNLRFQRGMATWPDQTITRRTSLAQKQAPFAQIFSCVDSRVSPELVFDQGLGDLFVIRTAAHVIDKAALGSLEFGVAELKIPLLMVLGHERCGAVIATISAVDSNGEAPGSISALVDYIRPSVQKATGTGATRLDNAVRLNTSNTVEELRKSKIIDDALNSGKLTLVGARYDLDSGVVSIITQ